MNLGFRPVSPQAAEHVEQGRQMLADATTWLADIDDQLPAQGSPTEEVAEATTVQPEGDPTQPGACREHLEPVEVVGRRPEPLTGQCQGGPIQDLAREQHHSGSHGPRVPPADHVALARPVRLDSVDAYIACCMCGWEGSYVTVSEAGGVAHARTRAMLAAERHACIEEDKQFSSSRSAPSPWASSGKPAASVPPGAAGTFANKRSAAA